MRNISRRIDTIEQKMNIGRHRKTQRRFLYLSKEEYMEDGCPKNCVVLGVKKQRKSTKNNQFPES